MFYNFLSVSAIQPGCNLVNCAHARAWKFYSETVYPGNENNFLAVKCNSLAALNTGRCPGKSISMGYAVSTDAKGNYFLSTNSNSPFGRRLVGVGA